MGLISIAGFYDLHVHSSPSPFRRIADSGQIARWCAQAGMAAICIKSHFESTVSKSYFAQQQVADYPGFRVFASIALNRGVGGINPGAVELALEQGARIVWFPTMDAAAHAAAFGGVGTFGRDGMRLAQRVEGAPRGGYSPLQNGKLTPESREVIALVKAYDAVLATGHISRDEVMAVIGHGAEIGHKRLVVTHPEFVVPNLGLDDMKILRDMGAMFEFCAVNTFPLTRLHSVEHIRDMIMGVGPEHCYISTDAGQPFNAIPPETMRVFAQSLHEAGVDEATLRMLAIDNPKRIIGA
jgi:Family of unknown function (DUF6282)